MASKRIYQWNLSNRAIVYPHLELDNKSYSQDEMRKLCNTLKQNMSKYEITIYDQSSYCNEINGPWNVCFSINNPLNNEKYTYIIRRCVEFNKTFGCPFLNEEYAYDLNTLALLETNNQHLFQLVESKLMELCPNSKKVNYFDI